MAAPQLLDQIFLADLVTEDDFPDLSVYYPELRPTMSMIMCIFRKRDIIMDNMMRDLERLVAI